jgi:hypothetical protein
MKMRDCVDDDEKAREVLGIDAGDWIVEHPQVVKALDNLSAASDPIAAAIRAAGETAE